MSRLKIIVIYFFVICEILSCKSRCEFSSVKRNIRHTPVKQIYADTIVSTILDSYISFFEYMTISYGGDEIYKDIRVIQTENAYILIYQDSNKGYSFFIPLEEEDFIDFIKKIKIIYEYRAINEKNQLTGPSSGIESFCIRCIGNIIEDSIVIPNKSLLSENDYRLKLALLFEELSRFTEESYEDKSNFKAF